MSYEEYRRNRQRREAYARRYRTEDTNIFGEKSLLIAILRGMTERKEKQARQARAKTAVVQAKTAALQQARVMQDQIQAGALQARRLAEQTVPDCEQAVSAEFTGIGADGGLHYRVTYIKRDGEIATAG